MTQQEANSILKDLRGTKGFPENGWMRVKLRDTIQRLGSPARARAIIDKHMDESPFCPDASALIALSHEVPLERSAREDCQICDGIGYVLRYFLVTHQDRGRLDWRQITEDQYNIHCHQWGGWKIHEQYAVAADVRCSCMPPLPRN